MIPFKIEQLNGHKRIQATSAKYLRAHPANVRTHPKRQVLQIIASIKQFGFTVPVIVDEANVILAGHGRWVAARELQLETVPVIVVTGLSEPEKTGLSLADNKIGEAARWQRSALSLELKLLSPLLEGMGLGLELTGFGGQGTKVAAGNRDRCKDGS